MFIVYLKVGEQFIDLGELADKPNIQPINQKLKTIERDLESMGLNVGGLTLSTMELRD